MRLEPKAKACAQVLSQVLDSQNDLEYSIPGAELQFESEGISELEDSKIYIRQTSPASQILFWELHIHLGLQARNLDLAGDP